MTIRAVLWDADGVLQHGPASWREALDAANGVGFADAVFASELPALRGEEPLRAALERVVRAWPDATTGVDELLTLWERAVVDPEAMALVDEVTAGLVLSALATNQQDHRRAWMRDVLGYDSHFDRVFYSCEMGVMKPDPAYFGHILTALELGPDEVAFVDDSKATRELIATVVEGVDECQAFEAQSGFDALKILPRHQFDLIITDINMPDINGLELINFVKKNPNYRETPLLIVSTESSEQDRLRGLALGASDYLVKPFEPDALLALVRRYLGLLTSTASAT